MKVFERDGKVNFVDDNNVLVGFDYQGCCCEFFGWLWTEEIPDASCVECNEHSDPSNEGYDGWQFDKDFYETFDNADNETASAIFKLTKDDEVRYLTIFNIHNGYYGHGFTMEIGDKIIRDGTL